jgi:hypothetical protein
MVADRWVDRAHRTVTAARLPFGQAVAARAAVHHLR